MMTQRNSTRLLVRLNRSTGFFDESFPKGVTAV